MQITHIPPTSQTRIESVMFLTILRESRAEYLAENPEFNTRYYRTCYNVGATFGIAAAIVADKFTR